MIPLLRPVQYVHGPTTPVNKQFCNGLSFANVIPAESFIARADIAY